MKSNFEKIVNNFIRFDYSKRTTNLFYRWMISDNSATEKDEVFRKLWRKTKSNTNKNTEESFRQVLDKIGVQPAPIIKINRLPIWRYAAAVVFIICLSITGTLWFTESHIEKDAVAMIEHYVKNGKREIITLPDGSTIHLNSGSHIFYPENLEGKTRTVYLLGEADFKVAKNPEKPFIVRSADMAITALGTEFNVKAYPEEDLLTATLLEGKVRVNCNDTTNYILTPGQQVVYTKSTLKSVLVETDVADVTAWQRGEIILNKATINEIIQTLERHYGIAFHSSRKEISQDRYSLVFKENANIKEVLEVMQTVIGEFDYHLKENSCYIYWK